ncbi:type 4 prepilin-like proteins leader peptide-processing enzyme [Caldalkalibacillus thermarum]|nr:type 4 prepilin-like proteins leader peptide-processing enzyme [Caldalkalibacillus thermarum]
MLNKTVLLLDLVVIVSGLLMGSFYNVVAYRLLKGESVVWPPSRCPQCQTRLSWLELIPFLSYLWLGGRCRHCLAPISWLYPFGELVTALSFYLVYVRFGLSGEFLVGLLLSSMLVLAMLTDLRATLILDKITFPLLVLLLLVRLWYGPEPWWWYVLGGLSLFGLLLVIAVLSRGGMGMGDVKLSGAIGLALGPCLGLFSLVLASFAGTLAGVVLLALGRLKRRQPIPFAPFIWIGTLMAYLYGEDLWQWYMGLW